MRTSYAHGQSSRTLDAETVATIDSTDQMRDVLAMGRHMRDALARVDAAGIAPVDASGGLVVAGMGGSAAGGRLAIAALGSRLRRPMIVESGYGLPGWIGSETLVLCSSYSGNTEETLAAFDDATMRGAPRIVATTGGELARRAREQGVPVIQLADGFQPRAAIGYALTVALQVAALCGCSGSIRDEIDAAADLVDRLADAWGPQSAPDSDARSLARALHRTLPVFAGAELSAAAAYRWKCQFNENASVPAFASTLPEADHNEVVGWDAAKSLGRLSYVSLEDPGAHPRNALRAELTAEIARRGADPVLRVQARGVTPVERLLSLVLLGDLASIYAAILRQTDPVDIPAIDGLKATLAVR